jgi:hypothetical protein
MDEIKESTPALREGMSHLQRRLVFAYRRSRSIRERVVPSPVRSLAPACRNLHTEHASRGEEGRRRRASMPSDSSCRRRTSTRRRRDARGGDHEAARSPHARCSVRSATDSRRRRKKIKNLDGTISLAAKEKSSRSWRARRSRLLRAQRLDTDKLPAAKRRKVSYVAGTLRNTQRSYLPPFVLGTVAASHRHEESGCCTLGSYDEQITDQARTQGYAIVTCTNSAAVQSG